MRSTIPAVSSRASSQLRRRPVAAWRDSGTPEAACRTAAVRGICMKVFQTRVAANPRLAAVRFSRRRLPSGVQLTAAACGYPGGLAPNADPQNPRKPREQPTARLPEPHSTVWRSPAMRSPGGRLPELRGDQLGNLRRVERGALAQVVTADEQVQRPRIIQRPAQPADPRRVGADDVRRSRELAVLGVVGQD